MVPINTTRDDTQDALLVVDRNRAQDVRKVVDSLKEAMRSRLT